jgi:O-antigen/teichoic acid export membrane protein
MKWYRPGINRNLSALLIATIGSNILRLISNVLLARILSPEAFGLAGFAATIVIVAELVTDAGFRSYILSRKDDLSDQHISSLWTIRIIRGLALTLLLIMLAPYIDSFFQIHDLEHAIIIVSFVFLFSSLEPFTFFLQERQNVVAFSLYTEFIATFVAIIIMVVTALLFESVWCLVIGQLYKPLIVNVVGILYRRRFHLQLKISKEYSIHLLAWSKYIIPSSVITFLLMQSDKFILGKMLSVEMLGIYYIAANLAVAVFTVVQQYSRRVFMPAVANYMHTQSSGLRNYIYSVKGNILIICSIGIGVGIAYASHFIDILYDDRYSDAANILSILLINSVLSLVTYPGESVLVSMRLVRTTLFLNILRLIWIIITLYPLYYYYGIYGLFIAFSTMDLLPVIYILKRLSDYKLLDVKYESVVIVIPIIIFVSYMFL